MFILGLLSVVFAILHLILFFKVWGMTNNVSWIRDYLEGAHVCDERSLAKAIARKDPNVEKMLFDWAYSHFWSVYFTYKDYGETEYWRDRIESAFSKALKEISVAYDKAGIAVPDAFQSIKSCKDFDDIFNL